MGKVNHTLLLNRREVLGRLNLAYVALARKEPERALAIIGEALGHDEGGDYREALLAKQAEAIAWMAERHHVRTRRGMSRLSGHLNLQIGQKPM